MQYTNHWAIQQVYGLAVGMYHYDREVDWAVGTAGFRHHRLLSNDKLDRTYSSIGKSAETRCITTNM